MLSVENKEKASNEYIDIKVRKLQGKGATGKTHN